MTYSTVDREHPSYTQEPVSKLGETGGTVVYIFPDGDARVKKGKKASDRAAKRDTPSRSAIPTSLNPVKIQGDTHKSKNHAIPKPPSQVNQSIDQSANRQRSQMAKSDQPVSQKHTKTIGDRLVEAGVISSTQLQVALYDQQTMHLRLDDVLMARGWIDQETLNSFSFA